MQKKRFAVLISLFLLSCICFAQIPDSLLQKLRQAESDTDRINARISIGQWASTNDGKILDSLAAELATFSTRTGIKKGHAWANSHYAISAYYQNKTSRSDSCFSLAADQFAALNMHEEAITNRTKSGIIKMLQGDFEQAIAIFDQSIQASARHNLLFPLCHALNEKATAFHYQGEYDSAQVYYEKTIDLAKKQEFNYERSLYNLSVLYSEQYKLQQANLILQQLYESQKASGKSRIEQGKTLSAIGENYRLLGDFPEAIDHLLQSAELLEAAGEWNFVSSVYSQLAKVYLNIEDTVQNLAFHQKALQLSQNGGNFDNKAQLLYDMAISYEHYRQYPKALALLDSIIFLSEKYTLDEKALDAYNLKLKILASLQQWEQLWNSIQQLEEIVWSHQPPLKPHFVFEGKTRYYLGKKAYQKALEQFVAIPDSILNSDNLITNGEYYNLGYQVYKGIGNAEKALYFYERDQAIQDSLINTNSIRKLAVAQYQNEKKQLIWEKEQQEALYQAEQQAKKNQRNGFIVGLIALGLIAFLFYRNFRIKRKAADVLTKKNQLIEKQKEELTKLNHLKDRIFAILGHDLRKPALAFRGLSKKLAYLIQKEDFQTLQKIGIQLEADADQLHSLTDNILHWALIQKSDYTYRPQTFDLAESIADVTAIFERAAQIKSVQIDNQVHDQLLVKADPHAIQTVIRNLLDNAVKYTDAGGKITLQAENTANTIQFSIQDTGTGIPPEQQQQLFALQAEKSQTGTAGEQGTGLGLHLVNELVHQNGGQIRVQSEVNVGTTFEVELPKAG